MINIKDVNPTRLKHAREGSGVCLDCLANILNISKIELRKYESGKKKTPHHIAVRASHILSYPLKFFYGKNLPEIDGPIFFRGWVE